MGSEYRPADGPSREAEIRLRSLARLKSLRLPLARLHPGRPPICGRAVPDGDVEPRAIPDNEAMYRSTTPGHRSIHLSFHGTPHTTHHTHHWTYPVADRRAGGSHFAVHHPAASLHVGIALGGAVSPGEGRSHLAAGASDRRPPEPHRSPAGLPVRRPVPVRRGAVPARVAAAAHHPRGPSRRVPSGRRRRLRAAPCPPPVAASFATREVSKPLSSRTAEFGMAGPDIRVPAGSGMTGRGVERIVRPILKATLRR